MSTLPPLTEQQRHPAYITVVDINARLARMLAAEFGGSSVVLVDLHATCVGHLAQHSPAFTQQQQQRPLAFSPLTCLWWMASTRVAQKVLRLPLDTIARWRGLHVLSDQVSSSGCGGEHARQRRGPPAARLAHPLHRTCRLHCRST